MKILFVRPYQLLPNGNRRKINQLRIDAACRERNSKDVLTLLNTGAKHPQMQRCYIFLRAKGGVGNRKIVYSTQKQEWVMVDGNWAGVATNCRYVEIINV